ncbi:hypothetical protein M0R45_004532 [Rubus argutus]|uniref:Uncharacterized protein n=1 Tax=Rubus argutus TaxID=59490 RepID=A0AAW1YK07_RUBAR
MRLRTCKLASDLEIVSHSLFRSLHHFEMIHCLHPGTLRISAIKLTVFEYYIAEKCMDIPFLNAAHLTSMHFHKLAENRIPALVSQFRAAQDENLNPRIVSERVMPISITPFWNLKQLELTIESNDIVQGSDMLLVFAFLKASPLVKNLN